MEEAQHAVAQALPLSVGLRWPMVFVCGCRTSLGRTPRWMAAVRSAVECAMGCAVRVRCGGCGGFCGGARGVGPSGFLASFCVRGWILGKEPKHSCAAPLCCVRFAAVVCCSCHTVRCFFSDCPQCALGTSYFRPASVQPSCGVAGWQQHTRFIAAAGREAGDTWSGADHGVDQHLCHS